MNFNILIVDDEEDIVDILVSIVGMFFTKEYPFLNTNISKALNGEEALAITKNNNQDIILSDIVMPKMDGLEFIRNVRLFDKSVPILVLSALNSKEDIDRIMYSGATNYTSKPLNAKLFIAQIKVFVDFYIKRQHIYNKQSVNLFTKNIYNRKVEFFITKENDLLEFWEYIVKDELNIDKIDEALQYIYAIESLMIKQGISNTIILEENDTEYYITFSNFNKLTKLNIDTIYDKYKVDINKHKNDGFFDSFIISKNNLDASLGIEKTIVIKPKNLTTIEQELKETLLMDIRYSTHEKITLETFLSELEPNYEDKIENFLDDLAILNIRIYNLEENCNQDKIKLYIKDIVSYFNNFYIIVNSIGLFNVISRAFSILMNFLDNLDKEFIENMEKRILLSKMLLSLINDLEVWIIALFIDKNATDIHYFDASFSDDCLAIISTFSENDETEDNETEDDDGLEFF